MEQRSQSSVLSIHVSDHLSWKRNYDSVPSIFSVAQLRERSVYVQFSNHKELKTDQTHSNASASAQAALQAAQALIGQDAQVAAGNVAAGLQGAITPKIQHTASVNGHGASGGELVPPRHILKLIGKVCP